MDTSSALFDLILNATQVQQVTDVIDAFSENYEVAWLPVGGNENNFATVNLGSDPAAGLIERVTNAIDAVIDREWLKRGQPSNILSPRQATEQWFGINNGRLADIDISDPTIIEISKRVQVTLKDSEKDDRPTVDIRDAGTGLRTEDFASSILSLNGSRKLKKLFLAGAFGQGGSTALSYSQYTIILSRFSDADPNNLYPVAVTLVRFNAGNPTTDKHGLYEYLVDEATGCPFVFNVDAEVFAQGTLVRHVSMDLGKYKSVMTAQTNSLWYLAHNYLFDPVLPFRIEERRDNASNGNNRTVAGNNRLLTTGKKNTDYKREATLTFRDGSVTIYWWVLSAEGEHARNRITQYTMSSQPIVVTYNGQKQGDLPNTIIKNDLKMPYLDRYLIVQIDCDRLDSESRRQLFPSTRESLRDTSIMSDLKRLVIDTLDGDPDLRRLDHERKQRYIRRVDNDAVDNIRKRLAKRISAVITVAGGGKSPRVLPPDDGRPTAAKIPIDVQEPPTLFEITSPNPRKVYAGKRFTLSFKTNGAPSYFVNPDTFIAIIDPPSFGQYTGTTNVRFGYGTAYFVANADVEVGTKATLTLEVRPRRSPSLRHSIELELISLPEDAGGDQGQAKTPNIGFQWVSQGDDYWKLNNWDETSVARVETDDDSIDIFVSSDNRRLNSLIARAQRRETNAVDSVKAFYLEHLSFYALLTHIDAQRLQSQESTNGNSPDTEELEHEHERGLKRACETVCGIMESMFDILVTKSASSDEVLVDGSNTAVEDTVD